jgi:hypothetical protein
LNKIIGKKGARVMVRPAYNGTAMAVILKFKYANRSEPGNPLMHIVFMLAIGTVFRYMDKTRRGRCSADLALA